MAMVALPSVAPWMRVRQEMDWDFEVSATSCKDVALSARKCVPVGILSDIEKWDPKSLESIRDRSLRWDKSCANS